MLIALMAPRPVYIGRAQEDHWSDPQGEFLSSKHVQEVYQLFGYSKNLLTEWPTVNTPVIGRIGYYHNKKAKLIDMKLLLNSFYCPFCFRVLSPLLKQP